MCDPVSDCNDDNTGGLQLADFATTSVTLTLGQGHPKWQINMVYIIASWTLSLNRA